MTMLFHSGAPLFLWVKVFSTIVYLINRLPSSALNPETSYFSLHGTHPDYTSLCVFGFKCFPYTWDTRQHKFDPKTVLCVFVGYSDKHKGYKCFHPSSIISPTSHVISIFYSWLSHINSTHNVKIESQTLTPPCISPLPVIPLLTSVSNTVTGSSSKCMEVNSSGLHLRPMCYLSCRLNCLSNPSTLHIMTSNQINSACNPKLIKSKHHKHNPHLL